MPVPTPLTTNAQHNKQYPRTGMPTKTVKRKSSKPIINWLQRKLGSTVRARRPSDTTNVRGASADSTYSGRATSLKELQSTMVVHGRAPAPAPPDVDENGHLMRAHGGRPLSNQISLNSTAEMSDTDSDDDGMSNRRSSGAAASMWGARSNPLEADEDASIRPLPPTSPPSPSPSRSSSSYMSDPRTFKSISASTKPTTLLSIDLTPGVAHIAQAPPTPTTSVSASYTTSGPSPITRFPPHVRTQSSGYGSSAGVVTFSALPPASPPSSRPSSLGPVMRTGPGALQAPAHTTHHPRNNPRPSSPPLDNASVLTLASSAFAATSGERDSRGRAPGPATSFQYTWAAAADTASHISHFDGTGDSASHIMLDGDGAPEEQNASVRALRPRSARRDSWESEVSRWSAGVSVLGAMGPGGRERSVRTAPSFRTGGQNTLDVDPDVDDSGSVSLIDEDVISTKEDAQYDAEGKDDASPLSMTSVEGVLEECSPRASVETGAETETDAPSAQESHEIDDVATPGPAERTLALVPSLETMPKLDRPATPPSPSLLVREPEMTPKKEKKKTELDTDGAEL